MISQSENLEDCDGSRLILWLQKQTKTETLAEEMIDVKNSRCFIFCGIENRLL